MSARQHTLSLPLTSIPNRMLLETELVALQDQYRRDVDMAESIRREHEEIVRAARLSQRAAKSRMHQLTRLLDAEFPGWQQRQILSESSVRG